MSQTVTAQKTIRTTGIAVNFFYDAPAGALNNPVAGVGFSQEEAFKLEDGRVLRSPIMSPHPVNLTFFSDALNSEIPLLDESGEDTGETISRADFLAAIRGLYSQAVASES